MALNDEQRDWLTLALVPGVGTVHFIRLLARFRTPAAVLRASQGALQEVVGPKLAERIAHYADMADINGQVRAMEQYDARLVTMNDALYPARLGEIYDPPLALFYRGELIEADEHCVAIVGTRRATPYGIRMAEKFGRELGGRGITVVSGMASGIDAAAHRGAIQAGGRTIAVLGCGVDKVYPQENADLMDAIMRHGAVMSQFSMGTKPSRGHFPYRNRIISGMTLGTLIVQAPLKSGALITAHQALEQGREVFAVPGEIGNKNSEGPHALIREGAKLVETVDDILMELALPPEIRVNVPERLRREDESPQRPAPARQVAMAGGGRKPQRRSTATRRQAAPAARTQTQTPATSPPSPTPPSERERAVLAALAPDGSYVDEIAAVCRVPVSEALSALTLLELKGLVRQFSGKRFAPR